MDAISSHRGVGVVLVLMTALILEGTRRLTGYPRLGDLRGMVLMAASALAVATVGLLAFTFLFHMWPFSS